MPHQVTREEIFVALEGVACATLDGVAMRVLAGDILVLSPGVEFTIVASGPEAFTRSCVCPWAGRLSRGTGRSSTPPWAE